MRSFVSAIGAGLLKAIRQTLCYHLVVIHAPGTLNIRPRRCCEACGLEEFGSYASRLVTDDWIPLDRPASDARLGLNPGRRLIISRAILASVPGSTFEPVETV